MGNVFFEDVREGQEIPSITANFDSQKLVYWAAGSGDYYQIHYDKDYALANNLPERIVHGALKHALLGRLLHEWLGGDGRIRKVACQYRGMDLIGKDITCKGVVTAKKTEGGENLVELEVWTEDFQGNKTTPGTAVVSVPSRG